MTITESVTEAHGGELADVVPSFTMNAHTFRDMLAGGIVASGRDATLPALVGVHFHWADGDPVRVASTDRYRLALGVSGVVGHGAGAVTVRRSDAVELVKALPKLAARDRWEDSDRAPMVTVTVLSWLSVTVRFDGADGLSWSREIVPQSGEFPKYRTLIPAPESFTGTESIAWNPSYLADVDNIPHERNMPVRWRFTAPTRPAVATYPTFRGVDWLYLLMPVRVTDDGYAAFPDGSRRR